MGPESFLAVCSKASDRRLLTGFLECTKFNAQKFHLIGRDWLVRIFHNFYDRNSTTLRMSDP
jgi:hypothetical protein